MTCHVYVSCAEAKEVQAFRLDPASGSLSLLGRTPVPTSGEGFAISMPLALSPDGRVLHAAVRTPPFAAISFAVDAATGRLTPTGSTPLPASMSALCTSRDGRDLLAASFPQGLLSWSRIDAGGRLETPPAEIVPDLPEAHGVLLDPSNRFAFVAVLGEDAIAQFTFDAERGRLAPNDPAKVPLEPFAGPRHLAWHPTRPILYCLNERSGAVDVLRLDVVRGTLAPHQRVGSLPEADEQRWRDGKADRGRSHPPSGSLFDPRTAGAADIHLTPDGRFLYTSLRTANLLVGFEVDPIAGELRRIGAWRTAECPRSFAIDPTGYCLIAAGQATATLAVFNIDQASGELTESRTHATGRGPNWIAIRAAR